MTTNHTDDLKCKTQQLDCRVKQQTAAEQQTISELACVREELQRRTEELQDVRATAARRLQDTLHVEELLLVAAADNTRLAAALADAVESAAVQQRQQQQPGHNSVNATPAAASAGQQQQQQVMLLVGQLALARDAAARAADVSNEQRRALRAAERAVAASAEELATLHREHAALASAHLERSQAAVLAAVRAAAQPGSDAAAALAREAHSAAAAAAAANAARALAEADAARTRAECVPLAVVSALDTKNRGMLQELQQRSRELAEARSMQQPRSPAQYGILQEQQQSAAPIRAGAGACSTPRRPDSTHNKSMTGADKGALAAPQTAAHESHVQASNRNALSTCYAPCEAAQGADAAAKTASAQLQLQQAAVLNSAALPSTTTSRASLPAAVPLDPGSKATLLAAVLQRQLSARDATSPQCTTSCGTTTAPSPRCGADADEEETNADEDGTNAWQQQQQQQQRRASLVAAVLARRAEQQQQQQAAGVALVAPSLSGEVSVSPASGGSGSSRAEQVAVRAPTAAKAAALATAAPQGPLPPQSAVSLAPPVSRWVMNAVDGAADGTAMPAPRHESGAGPGAHAAGRLTISPRLSEQLTTDRAALIQAVLAKQAAPRRA
jgi:trimeric autotransporter adhesin